MVTTRRARRAGALVATVLLAACGGSSAPTVRTGALTAVLGSPALDGSTFCTSVPAAEEAEGGLAGSVERSSATFSYAGPAADPLHSRLHVSLDRFQTAAAASSAADRAATAERDVLGAGAHAAGTLSGWTGAQVVARSFDDYTGAHRTSFAAVVAIGPDVVRIESLGVPAVATAAAFDRLTGRLLDGLVGRATGHPVASCVTAG